jgi:hypothetical protein
MVLGDRCGKAQHCRIRAAHSVRIGYHASKDQVSVSKDYVQTMLGVSGNLIGMAEADDPKAAPCR